MLVTRIILNNFLSKKVFYTKFFGMVPYLNEMWPDNFEIVFKEAKAIVTVPEVNLSNFGPLSLCFKHRMLAHIIANTLIS